jgi:hypothetical protein
MSLIFISLFRGLIYAFLIFIRKCAVVMCANLPKVIAPMSQIYHSLLSGLNLAHVQLENDMLRCVSFWQMS